MDSIRRSSLEVVEGSGTGNGGGGGGGEPPIELDELRARAVIIFGFETSWSNSGCFMFLINILQIVSQSPFLFFLRSRLMGRHGTGLRGMNPV